MSSKRQSRTIKDKAEVDEICSLTADDIGTSKFMEMFGTFKGKAKYHTYDIIEIPVGAYGVEGKKNKTPFVTTLGKYIFNKLFIEAAPTIFEQIKWVNDDVNKKVYGKLYDKLGYMRLEDKVSRDDYIYFCDNTQTLMPYVSVIANGFSDVMLTSTAKINKKKEALLKANKAAIDAGDIKVLDAIQRELLDYAKEILADDPSMDMFNSGAGGDFDNNYKNMFIMKGASSTGDPHNPYTVITSNYMDGISAEEYAKFANSLQEGPYMRAKKTESGGYWEKLFVAALQHITLLDEGSDCGTKKYITETLTASSIEGYMYCYVIEGDKLVEITSDNTDSYIGKTVKLRYSSVCEAKGGTCNKCAGNIFYRLGVKNIGMMTPQLPSRVKLMAMKSFHNNQVALSEMDPMEAFGLS